jgi:cytochrome P450
VYLIYTILEHAEVVTKLLAALEPLRSHDITKLVDAQFTKIPYLQWVIEEGLRLHPGVQTALPRYVPKGGRNLAGYFIPEGTTIESQNYSAHRDPKIFAEPEK